MTHGKTRQPDLTALIRQVQSGDVDAYGVIVERFQDMAVGYAYSILRDFHLAEDAAQEAFVEAYRAISKLQIPKAFPNWFRKIVLKRCDRIIRRKSVPTVPLDKASNLPADSPTPAESAQRNELREHVLDAIRGLPDKQREATALFYINGYTQNEIADFLETPVATVKSRLHSARKRLKERMTDMVETELKKSRPSKKFSKKVMGKIRQVQVWVKDTAHTGVLLLTDSRKRTVPIFTMRFEAKAARDGQEAYGTGKAPDIYSALCDMLKRYKWKVAGMAVDRIADHTFYGRIRISKGGKTRVVDCRPSDGLNLAIRAEAAITVDERILAELAMKGDSGKLVSPGDALGSINRKTPRGRKPPIIIHPQYRNFEEALAELDKNPQSDRARKALREAKPFFFAGLVRDKKDAEEKFRKWVESKRGTPMEAMATGGWGAVILCPPFSEPKKALPFLRRAHRLAPEDRAIEFDFATALALTGDVKRAFDIVDKRQWLHAASYFANFEPFWKTSRFKSLIGKKLPKPAKPIVPRTQPPDGKLKAPDSMARRRFLAKQLAMIMIAQPNREMMFGSPKRRRSKSGVDRWPRPMRLRGLKRKREIEEMLGIEPSRRIKQVSGFSMIGGKEPEPGILESENGASLTIGVTRSEIHLLSMAHSKNIRPGSGQTFAAIAKAASLKIEAVVLEKRTRKGVEGFVIATDGKRREAIPIQGSAALAVAIRTKAPICVAEELAKKLERTKGT